jgi:xanthine dehydrogenase accessory factor
VYDIALTVAACLRAGTRVDVAWAVETHGFSARDNNEALALTPGGGRVGSVLSGSANDQLTALATESAVGRLVECHIGDLDASAAGLSCGGNARCLIVPAGDLPEQLWDRLVNREPVCLVTDLAGVEVLRTTMFTPETVADAGEDIAKRFGRARSEVSVTADRVVTMLWPVPQLVIVGAGEIAAALEAAARLLGWHAQAVSDADSATALINPLTVLDRVVVLSHDDEIAGPALMAALAGEVGYIGALGSRRTQQARGAWLADRGVTDLARIHGPAGLDIGAGTPAEIAVSIVAEALATRAGTTPRSLRERTGSIH